MFPDALVVHVSFSCSTEGVWSIISWRMGAIDTYFDRLTLHVGLWSVNGVLRVLAHVILVVRFVRRRVLILVRLLLFRWNSSTAHVTIEGKRISFRSLLVEDIIRICRLFRWVSKGCRETILDFQLRACWTGEEGVRKSLVVNHRLALVEVRLG